MEIVVLKLKSSQFATALSKRLGNVKVRALVRGNVHYKAWCQPKIGRALTKTKNSYWADFRRIKNNKIERIKNAMVIKNLKIIVFVLAIIVAIIFVGRYFIPIYNNVKFEKVYESKISSKMEKDLYWFSLRDPNYSGFFDISYLKQLGVKDINNDLDIKNNTYIVTINHELKNISYSYSDMKNRKKIVFPKQFVGKVELKTPRTNKVYIYKIKKMDIDCDYHDTDKNIIFK